MSIQWTEEYDVQVKEINDQHKHLIDIINRIFSVVESGRINYALEGFLQEVFDYAVFHFQTEERYFDLFQYEFSEGHKKEHREMLKKLSDFQARYRENGFSIAGEFVEFLEDWLVEHIGIHDKKYVKCFNEHGLS